CDQVAFLWHERDSQGTVILDIPARPGGGVHVDFTSQLSTGGSPQGYTLDVDWPTGASQPSGALPVTLAVDVPADPGGEWPAGTVSKAITLDFQSGETRMLVQKQSYDARFSADDGGMPMTVAPGAGEGGLPLSPAGDTPRLVLLAVRGTQVPWALVGGSDEPSLEPDKVYRSQLGSWQKVQATPGSQDVVLDTQPGGAVRLSLVDGSFNVVPQTAFRVHRCPREEHLTEESPHPEPCTLGAVNSDGMTGILPSLELNPAGGARGYLGIELTKAPVDPGTYYVLVESTGATPYRIRQGADLVRRAGQESEYLGAYAVCTVAGMEFLDQNFQRVDSFEVHDPTPAYVRLLGPTHGAASVVCQVRVQDRSGAIVSPEQAIDLSRVATGSNVYIGAITFEPDVAASPALSRSGDSLASSGVFMVPLGANTAAASAGGAQGQVGVDRPALLRLRFVDRQGTSLTANNGQVQETEIGSFEDNSPEIVNVQVQAIDPLDPSELTLCGAACDGTEVGVAERKNTKFDSGFQYFYDGSNGSTTLTSSGKIDGQWALRLVGGKSDKVAALKAVVRMKKDDQGAPYPTGTLSGHAAFNAAEGYGALLVPKCKRCRSVKEDPAWKLGVSLWVDERSYTRARGSSGSWIGSGGTPTPPNGVRDWLEARVRDFYATWPGTHPEIILGMSRLGTLAETAAASPGFVAQTEPDLPPVNGKTAMAKMTWALAEAEVRVNPAPNPSVERAFDEDGFHVVKPRLSFENIAVHEARHVWQQTYVFTANDPDTDGDQLPGQGAASAMGLVDSRYALDGLGSNTESDFLHPNLVDLKEWGANPSYAAAGHAPKEWDAIRLAGSLAGGAPTCFPAANYVLSLSAQAVGADHKLVAEVKWKDSKSIWHVFEGVVVIFEVVNSGNMLLSERLPVGDIFPPVSEWAGFGVSRVSDVLREGVTRAASRAKCTDPSCTKAEARVMLQPPPGGGATATRVRAKLVLPQECAGLTIVDEKEVTP
ncbi:MAG TPA: hypothetical protein P5234_00005, partial [Thermoanaerobaculaceae bacterium]|nr:hypothetical protein [Thermoanaerobaculaceae bacterium]